MAIHLGVATPRDGDYLAPCLKRLACLLDAGYEGQILLSDAAATVAGTDLPAGARLRNLGSHRLPDLLEAETIWRRGAGTTLPDAADDSGICA